MEIYFLGSELQSVSVKQKVCQRCTWSSDLCLSFSDRDLPLDTTARELLVLHSQVRGVEVCCCVEGGDG